MAIVVLLSATGLAGCKKSSTKPNALPDVYVSGYEVNHANSNTIAEYWKNGVAVKLSNGNTNAVANGIALSGNDIYVAGYEQENGKAPVAKYWKNGTAVNLTDGKYEATASAIAISGGDIYIVGFEADANGLKVAKFWKNGLAAALKHDNVNPTYNAVANGIVVKGGNFYASGYLYGGQKAIAVYWNERTFKELTDNTVNGEGFGIAVAANNDVYVAGNISPLNNSNVSTAQYWKNDAATTLSDAGSYATANAVIISGNDVYVAGSVNDNHGGQFATYWKNGTAVNVTNGTDGAALQAIAVVNGTVYTAGTQVVGTTEQPINWIGNLKVILNMASGNTQGLATGIAVK